MQTEGRRILRADGLAALEREAMLGTLADLLDGVRDLAKKTCATRGPATGWRLDTLLDIPSCLPLLYEYSVRSLSNWQRVGC